MPAFLAQEMTVCRHQVAIRQSLTSSDQIAVPQRFKPYVETRAQQLSHSSKIAVTRESCFDAMLELVTTRQRLAAGLNS